MAQRLTFGVAALSLALTGVLLGSSPVGAPSVASASSAGVTSAKAARAKTKVTFHFGFTRFWAAGPIRMQAAGNCIFVGMPRGQGQTTAARNVERHSVVKWVIRPAGPKRTTVLMKVLSCAYAWDGPAGAIWHDPSEVSDQWVTIRARVTKSDNRTPAVGSDIYFGFGGERGDEEISISSKALGTHSVSLRRREMHISARRV